MMGVYYLYVMKQNNDAAGFESARDDARGIMMCVDCGEKHVHAPDVDTCLRCDPDAQYTGAL